MDTPPSPSEKSARVGGIDISNSAQVTVQGDLVGGNKIVGYTFEEVRVLIADIRSAYLPEPFDGLSPYVGLASFQEQDAARFFGREKLTQQLVARVETSRFMVITGPSGSGKSSLARAGLIPTLKSGKLPGSNNWLYEILTPGRHSLEQLGRVVDSLTKNLTAGDDIQREGKTDATRLHRWLETALGDQKNRRAILLVDQFEEVFTQADETERTAFLNLLVHAATVKNGRVTVICVTRSDFIGNWAAYSNLNLLLSNGINQIPPMQPDELVSAIARPAIQVDLEIDPALVKQILDDMRDAPGALPLMQFALDDLFEFEKSKGGVIELTRDDYLERGGLQKALARHADAEFAKLSADEQQIARTVFAGLIEPGRGTADTKRRALFEELLRADSDPTKVREVVIKLADARLITTDEINHQETIALAHERLIDAWGWLRQLVDENRDAIVLQNQILADAQEWEQHGHDTSYLYVGAKLEGVHLLLVQKNLSLNLLSQTFIQAADLATEQSASAQEAAKRERDFLLESLRTSTAPRPIPSPDDKYLTTQEDLVLWCETHWEQAKIWLYSTLPDQVEMFWKNEMLAKDLRRVLEQNKKDSAAGLDAALGTIDPENYGTAVPSISFGQTDETKAANSHYSDRPLIDFGRLSDGLSDHPLILINTGRRYVKVHLELPNWVDAYPLSFRLEPGQETLVKLHAMIYRIPSETTVENQIKIVLGAITLAEIEARATVSRKYILRQRFKALSSEILKGAFSTLLVSLLALSITRLGEGGGAAGVFFGFLFGVANVSVIWNLIGSRAPMIWKIIGGNNQSSETIRKVGRGIGGGVIGAAVFGLGTVGLALSAVFVIMGFATRWIINTLIKYQRTRRETDAVIGGIPDTARQLGTRIGEYNVNLNRMVLGGVLAIFLVAFGSLIVYSVWDLFDNWLAFSIALGPVLFGLWFVFQFWQTFSLRVSVFQEGLVRIQGTRIDVFRWDQITTVWHKVIQLNYRLGLIPIKNESNLYIIQTTDGTRAEFRETLNNFQELGKILENETLRRLLPIFVEVYNQGGTVSFGSFRLSKRGMEYGNKTLEWAEIKNIQVNEEMITVIRRNGAQWATEAVSTFPNLLVFLKIANQIIGITDHR